MRLPVRLVYNLAEGSPRRRGRPVSLPPSYHLITGFYHLEPFLRFGKHVRETASFQQKGPPLTEWPSIIVELRGFGSTVGIPPFYRRFATLGTSSGTLRDFFSRFRSCPGSRRSRASNLPSHLLDALLRRGQGDPALRRAFLRAKHGRRPPGEAVACRPPSFFTSFLHSVFLFSIFYISVTFMFFVKRV